MNMKIELYRWYDASEILPEQTTINHDSHGVNGWFLIALSNGDLACANRWFKYGIWYWDTDDDYNDRLIERFGITHWMQVEPPK